MFGGTVPSRRFQLILIKPSHYDDDGYVIQWLRALVASNSLAVLYGLAMDAARRHVLGANVAIDIIPIDETHTRVNPKKIIARFRRHSGLGLVGLVGVQSSQFPRALDIARPLRAAGVPVMIGGFHVSGCLSMLPDMPSDLKTALDMGVSLFAGEAEERLDSVLRDAATASLRPIYNIWMTCRRRVGRWGFSCAARGRRRAGIPPMTPAAAVLTSVRSARSSTCMGASRAADRRTISNGSYGRTGPRVSIGSSSRMTIWLATRIGNLFLIASSKLRVEEGIALKLIIQVDTLCHKIPRFVEKCAAAGVTRVFIGLESINPDNLLAVKKRQNKITEYRQLLLGWKRRGVIIYVGYILGFPHDTPESIRRDIAIIQNELPIDIMEFFVLTPLPGSEDHQVLWRRGIAMDQDMNRFDTEHVVTAHPNMTRQEWEEIYRAAWDLYSAAEHRSASGAAPRGRLGHASGRCSPYVRC